MMSMQISILSLQIISMVLTIYNNYLFKNGHQEIAYVGNIYSTSSIQDRFLGYYKSLLEHGTKLNEQFIINDRDEHGTYIDISFQKKCRLLSSVTVTKWLII